MVAGPHLAHIIQEYEEGLDKSHADTNTKHHEKSTSLHTVFADDVRFLVAVLGELGNPFLDRTKELFTVDS